MRYVDVRKIILIAFITALMADAFAFSPAMARGRSQEDYRDQRYYVTVVTTRKVWKRNL